METTVPLSDSQLSELLRNSPLTAKLTDISELLKSVPSGTYTDKLNQAYPDDKKLIPVDLNNLNSVDFMIYKFGVYICQTISTHERPITLLLASSIPPNKEFRQNAYKNLFYFDSHNFHLYLRQNLTSDVGVFTTVLLHCISHVKIGEFGNDSSPVFTETLYSVISKFCRELYFNKCDRMAPVENVQEIFDIKLTGLGITERMEARVNEYQGIILKNKMVDQMEASNAQERGTSGTVFNAPSTSRYTIKKYKALALSELQDEEDGLNREFGVKCSEIEKCSAEIEELSHELTTQTALLETATGSQEDSIAQSKALTLSKLKNLKSTVDKKTAQQNEIVKKIKQVEVEIQNKSESGSVGGEQS